MSSLLERAAKVVHELHPNGKDRASVERAEWDAEGLLLLTSRTDVERWYRFNEKRDERNGRLRELRPENDPSVPLAAKLTSVNGYGKLKLLAYRPERRVVAKGSSPDGNVILKGYRRGRSRSKAHRHRVAESAGGECGFRIPQVLEHQVSDEALTLEFLDGQPMTLFANDAQHFFAVGNALRQFHRSTNLDGLDVFTDDDEISVLDRLASRCESIVKLPGVWSDLRTRLARISRELPSSTLGLTHRDLHDGQLLRIQDGLALVDFDLLCIADAALDVANLLCHVKLRSLQGIRGADEQSALVLGDALLDGWDRGAEPGLWERLRFYQATSFARLAFVYSLRPRWARLRGDLMQLATRCLEEIS